MAFFGGDPDNFEYPRYDLDICLFRVYQSGQPAKIEHFLKFNSNEPNDRELIFVSGSPGKTDRQLTLAEMADMRDRYLPVRPEHVLSSRSAGIGLQRAFI